MSDKKCEIYKNDEDVFNNSQFHIDKLCSSDRKRIGKLLRKFVKCIQIKNKFEINLAMMKSKNEVLINRYNFLINKHEDEKNELNSKLAEVTSQLDKLRLQTTYSLDLLTDQVIAQENEYLKITETVRNLLREKVKLESAINERDMRIRTTESKIARTEEQAIMEKLLLLNEYRNNTVGVEKIDRPCQTDEIISHNAIDNSTLKYKSIEFLGLKKSQSLSNM